MKIINNGETCETYMVTVDAAYMYIYDAYFCACR